MVGSLLAERVARPLIIIGSLEPPAEREWRDDLSSARGLLDVVSMHLECALERNLTPLIAFSECSICISTLPVVNRKYRDAEVLYFDAHGDFNTPATTRTHYLGGLSLAGACGAWQTGHGTFPAEQTILVGVRDLDPEEKLLLDRLGVTTLPANNTSDERIAERIHGKKVYVHIDLDVLDPSQVPLEYRVPGGMNRDELRRLLTIVTKEATVVGCEVGEFEMPDDHEEALRMARLIVDMLEPVTSLASDNQP